MLIQGSLFESLAAPDQGLPPYSPTRTPLHHGAWVDLSPGWVPEPSELFTQIHETTPWRAERRQMYDNVVAVPRLVAFFGDGQELPHPSLTQMRERLSDYYEAEMGERFVTTGMCLYRDGQDSVAWHGDRIGRSRTQDTVIAIVSLGSPRTLSLRPAAHPDGRSRVGGRLGFAQGHGDVLVMGGSCQRTWEHAILKSASASGARISIQFRVAGVR